MAKNEEIPVPEPNLKDRVVKKYEQIKAHVRENKAAYVVGTAGAALTIVTFVVTRRVSTRYMRIEGTATFIHKAVVKEGPLYNVFNIYAHGFKNRGPSWMIVCDQTGTGFRSIAHAASAMNLDPSSISRHLNGYPYFKTIHGYTFTKLGIGA
jgi:hypothetical protein